MALTKKAERTKAKLLASARKLISENGFDQVSVEDITKDSGVAKGTFYHYFKCKEDVVAELSFQTGKQVTEDAVNLDSNVYERCCYFIAGLFKDADWSGVRMIRQWLRESMESEGTPTETQTALENLRRAILKVMTVHMGEKPGELKKDAPVEMLARLVMGHFLGALTIWCMMDGEWKLSDDIAIGYTRMDIGNMLDSYMIGGIPGEIPAPPAPTDEDLKK